MPFDPSKHEGNSFDLIPPGDYDAIIEGADLKDTRAGTGAFLALTFQIISGELKGRKIWENLNIDNPNSTAVAIAENDLADICRAVGVDRLEDWAEFTAKNPNCTIYDPMPLANKPLVIKVGVRKRNDTGEDQNTIKAYLAPRAKSPKEQRDERARADINAASPNNEDDLPF